MRSFKNRTGWPTVRGDMREALDEHEMSQSPHPCSAVGPKDRRSIFIAK
jgi:hypothetical protein